MGLQKMKFRHDSRKLKVFFRKHVLEKMGSEVVQYYGSCVRGTESRAFKSDLVEIIGARWVER